MKFKIQYPYIDSSISNEITLNKYQEILKQKKIALNALMFEECMHAILGNYIDYLNSILTIGKDWNVNHSNNYVHKAIVEINRRINNLLSATYAYIDHGYERINVISNGRINFKDKKKVKIGNDLELEFLQHLRNYSQHYAFVVHRLSFGDTSSPQIIPYINLDIMKEGNNKERNNFFVKFNISKDELDLNILLKKLINYIWSLHQQIKQEINEYISNSHNLLKETIESIQVQTDKQCTMVKLVKENNDKIIGFDIINFSLISTYHMLTEENSKIYENI